MPNLYTPYSNGTWEVGFPSSGFRMLGNITSPPICGTFDTSNEFAIQGVYSGRVVIAADAVIQGSGIKYAYSNFYLRAGDALATNYVALTVGTRYLMKLKVRTPSVNPFADDDALICMGDINAIQGSDVVWTDMGGGKYKAVKDNGALGTVETILWKVSSIKDVTQEISVTWTEPALNYSFRNHSLFFLLKKPTLASGIPIVGTKNLLIGGKLWFDSANLDLETPVCDLVFGSPAYSKTDETNLDEDDGTITIHAQHTNPANDSLYVREYSLDGITWQFSNLFSALAPGAYSIYARNNSSMSCVISMLGAVTIISVEEEPPPPPEPPPSGELLVDSKPLNKGNFVQWYQTQGNVNFSGLAFQNCCWDLPRPYRIGKQRMGHAPIAVEDEVFTFYWNADVPLTNPEFTSLKLGLIGRGGLVVNEVGALSKDVFPDSVSYNIYSDEIIIPLGTGEGKYRLAIYHAVSGDILFVSNIIEVLSISESNCWSLKLWYRSTVNLYGFYYERVTNYLNKIRLRLYLLDDPVEGDFVQYRGASTGRLRNVSVELDRYIVLEAHYFDDAAHYAMEIFQAHDIILVNEKPYLVKAVYKKEPNLSLNCYKGKIELYEQEFSTANRFGQGDITIVGSEDPLLLHEHGRIRL